MKTTPHFTVKAAWMQSCGRGNKARSFPIIRTEHYAGVSPFFSRFYVLDMGNGREWTVANGRGAIADQSALTQWRD